MRAFLALALPAELRAQLSRLACGPGIGRVVAEENLHLTLHFLGDVGPEALGALDAALTELSSPPVTLRLAGLAPFGGRRPTLLTIGAAPVPELSRLHAKLAQAVRAAGIALERRRFRPHVTLLRFGRGLDARGQARLAAFIEAEGAVGFDPFTVRQFTLYRSHLHPDGAQYEALADYPLTL